MIGLIPVADWIVTVAISERVDLAAYQTS